MATVAPPEALRASNDSTFFMTSEELAEFLRVHKNAPAEWRAERRIDQPPYIRVGSLIRYSRAAVLEWCQARTIAQEAA